LLTATLLTGGIAHAADWRVEPSIRASSEYVDNPKLLPEGGEQLYGGVTDARVRMLAQTETMQLELTPDWHFASYPDDRDLNANDAHLDASLSASQGERLTWRFGLQGVRDSTLTSELGSTGLAYTNKRRELIAASVAPEWRATLRSVWTANVFGSTVHYIDAQQTGLVDYDYRGGSIGWRFSLTPRTSFTVDGNYGALDVHDTGMRQTSESVRFGAERDLGLLWHAVLSVGPSLVHTDFDDERGRVVAASITRRGERFQLHSTLTSAVEPTGQGVLAQRDELEAGTTHAVTEHLTLSVSIAAVRTHEHAYGVSTPEVRYYSAVAGAEWQFARQWFATLGISASTQSYQNYAGVDEAADSRRATLGIRWAGDPWLP
jgi:hypothetical protein